MTDIQIERSVRILKKKKFSGKLHIFSGRNRKSGETLVEVMVSAVIFLLLVALLEGSVAFCTNAQHKSREIRENASDAIEAYWTAKDSNSLRSGNGASKTLQFQTKDGVNVFSVDVTLDANTVSTESGDSVTFYTFGTETDASDSGESGD